MGNNTADKKNYIPYTETNSYTYHNQCTEQTKKENKKSYNFFTTPPMELDTTGKKDIIYEQLHKREKKKVVIIGFTFKENCRDCRNTKAYEVYKRLEEEGIDVRVYDPNVVKEEVEKEYGIKVEDDIGYNNDGIIILLKDIRIIPDNLKWRVKEDGVIYDYKGALKVYGIGKDERYYH